MAEQTPFRQVTDEMTGGCGCACHTGIGYRTSCAHCAAGRGVIGPLDMAAASRRIATLERQRAILGEAVADAVKWIHGDACLTNPAGCVCTQFIKALADVAALEAGDA